MLFVYEDCSLKERCEYASWLRDESSSATDNEKKGCSGNVQSDRACPCSLGNPMPLCDVQE
jgi:hypothetical protein